MGRASGREICQKHRKVLVLLETLSLSILLNPTCIHPYKQVLPPDFGITAASIPSRSYHSQTPCTRKKLAAKNGTTMSIIFLIFTMKNSSSIGGCGLWLSAVFSRNSCAQTLRKCKLPPVKGRLRLTLFFI